jgi:UTP--glucose-1-phosphate uridylyltransferase
MIRKCLFPAAGYGTRFLPATKATPKEMLPVLTKPLIQYGVEEALQAGISTMAIVTGRGKRAIEDHFDISYELEHQIRGTSKEPLLDEIRDLLSRCTFTYTRQKEMKGLGDAILAGESLIGDMPFAVLLADDLCAPAEDGGEGVLSQMVSIYDRYRCSVVAVEEVPAELTDRYGIVAGRAVDGSDDIYRVTEMVEKPSPREAPGRLAIIGRYILTPDIFEILRDTPPGRGGEVQITDALLRQAEEGRVIAYRFRGRRFDCGSVDGYVEATNHFYGRMKENGWKKRETPR